MSAWVSIAVGVVVVAGITTVTAYFVAQEFGFMAVDRSRLRARAADGDAGASRALEVTGRTSFMLSGAQLGITVTGLLAGYVAEPMIGDATSELLGGAGLPPGAGVAIGATSALLLVTVVQMVFGELFPKNLAIARPEPVARWLALSTTIYLRLLGPVITVFDKAAVVLLRAVRIEPVEDVHHAATAADLQRIVADSAASGELPEELSALLDRSLDFDTATAEHAMVPRPRVVTVAGDRPASAARSQMLASGYSRLPVLGPDVDEVAGVIGLRDLITLPDNEDSATAADLARPAVIVPTFQRLPDVLARLRQQGEQFACVVDEYGALAGIITLEDIAEELVGEISDQPDAPGDGEASEPRQLEENTWLVPGALGVDEVERLIGSDLPSGHFESIGGLVISQLGRLPRHGDQVHIELPGDPAAAGHDPAPVLRLTVESIDRRVPKTLLITLTSGPAGAIDPGAGEV